MTILGAKKMITGSCLCGCVKFEIEGKPRSLSYCHCGQCQKSGGVFSAVLVGDSKSLTVIGQENIVRHKPEEPWNYSPSFCKKCGSSLGELATDEGIYVVAVSALDNDPGIKPTAHLHTASKPPWFDIRDNQKQLDGDYFLLQ